MLNSRERFLRSMCFQAVDRPPLWKVGYWKTTLQSWNKEGLPEDERISDYFGFDRKEETDINLSIVPGFKRQIIDEDERRI